MTVLFLPHVKPNADTWSSIKSKKDTHSETITILSLDFLSTNLSCKILINNCNFEETKYGEKIGLFIASTSDAVTSFNSSLR